ncbi:excisionase family DNA binding protein [Homoserinimonas aerilata]|uniref:Excisionase family DNA binding protein n=1 Tax=Homoserinimonas aerilata TaxID=1162970 RepID=A0A542YL23_9MICO|nr:helix-turn-helix domain-containing protein [Homoserinimonas aerilata]TQL48778.1 excisionase family DNA binding protein [Homoserinimonas aerilata]
MISTLEEARRSPVATLTLKEAGQILGINPRTVSGAIAAGEVPAVRFGRRVLIPRERFIAMLDGRTAVTR